MRGRSAAQAPRPRSRTSSAQREETRCLTPPRPPAPAARSPRARSTSTATTMRQAPRAVAASSASGGRPARLGCSDALADAGQQVLAAVERALRRRGPPRRASCRPRPRSCPASAYVPAASRAGIHASRPCSTAERAADRLRRRRPRASLSNAARRRIRSLTRNSQAPAGPSSMNQKITPKIRLLACTKMASSTASRSPAPRPAASPSSSSLARRAASSRSPRSSAVDVVVDLVAQVARPEREEQHQHRERELRQAEQVRRRARGRATATGSTGSSSASTAAGRRSPRRGADRIRRATQSQYRSSQRGSRRWNRCVRPRSQRQRQQQGEQAHAGPDLEVRSAHERAQQRPVEGDARIGLAAGRHVAVADDRAPATAPDRRGTARRRCAPAPRTARGS